MIKYESPTIKSLGTVEKLTLAPPTGKNSHGLDTDGKKVVASV